MARVLNHLTYWQFQDYMDESDEITHGTLIHIRIVIPQIQWE